MAELEAEFFGTDEDGQQSAGKLELAIGGTLFLDEVEKLPLEMGDKLADALTHGLPATEKGGKPRMFDVRVIAACDSNLKRLADKACSPVICMSWCWIPPCACRLCASA